MYARTAPGQLAALAAEGLLDLSKIIVTTFALADFERAVEAAALMQGPRSDGRGAVTDGHDRPDHDMARDRADAIPEMFPGPLGVSLAGRALASGLWVLEALDIRDQATDRHRSVDDTPAGGGPGMVLRADVLAAAIDAVEAGADRPRLLMSPRGRPLTQSRVLELATGPGPLIVCGRFEGVDQRVIEARQLEEVSIGDYVLSGGEIAAMALIDACVGCCRG